MTQPLSSRRAAASSTARGRCAFEFDGARYEGHRRRHARLGAARQRRPPRRAQLQVSPAARHLHAPAARSRTRWCSSRAARAPSPTCARRPPSSTTGWSPRARTAGRRSRFDVGAINGALSRFLPAGFYYKTFMWPSSPQAWLRYEHVIRAAAGLGRAATAPDPDRYEHQYAHCDVLIVGAGPAGLAAARAAASRGRARDRLRRGLALRRQPDRRRGDDRRRRRDAAGSPRRCASWRRIRTSRCSPRTTAFGCYDDNLAGTCWSASPIISRRRRRTRRGSGCGKCAQGRSCSRRARTSGRSPTRTTTCRARCSPAPRAPTSSATRCGRERAR